jgi:hypothetical protein
MPTYIAGANTSNVLNVDQVTGITRGSGFMAYLDPHQPTARAHEWNMTLEREMFGNTVVKASWIGTHGARMSQWTGFNETTTDYTWYTQTGMPKPGGEYASVARRPYNNTTLGSILAHRKIGWSNDNSLQLEFEHRYSKGYGFQVFYVMSNAMRVAGDGWRDDQLNSIEAYPTGTVPADDNARDRLLFYRRDTSIPKHRLNWNFLVDLPFGRGKHFGHDAGKGLNMLIGGWQLAGYGQLYSRYLTNIPTSYWNHTSAIQDYGKAYPIQDCRTGTCYDGYLYWNGYIPANKINSHDKNGKPDGVMGVPDSYVPFATPLNPKSADGNTGDDTNNVFVTLRDGSRQKVAYDTGLNPYRNQYILGPMIWNMSASLFKTIPITERVMMRVNVDFLDNAFNMPGTTLPDASGVIINKTSANSPRVLQLTARLTW